MILRLRIIYEYLYVLHEGVEFGIEKKLKRGSVTSSSTKVTSVCYMRLRDLLEFPFSSKKGTIIFLPLSPVFF